MRVEDYSFESEFNGRNNLLTRKMIRLLSQDARMPISGIAKELGMSRVGVRTRLGRMEQEFGMHYVAELNEDVLGFTAQHLISVKFDKKPDYERIKMLLEKSYIPQLAFTTKGAYDLIIYAVAASTMEYAHWDRSMQILLAEYGAEWKTSEVVHRHLGFCPVRPELLDRLDIPEKYRGMLKILGDNARTSFKDMSAKLGMHFNTVAYNFNKIVESGYVRRFTVTMEKPKDISVYTFLITFKPREGFEKASAQARKFVMIEDKDPLINRVLLSANLIGSYDLFFVNAFDDVEAALKKFLAPYKKMYESQGVKVIGGEVDRVILGRLPVRSVDTTKEYDTIVWDPNFEKKDPVNQ